MLYTRPSQLRFPGAVPALLAWADGDTEGLAERVQAFRADVPRILQSVNGALKGCSAGAVRQLARDLRARLAPFGVPQIQATVGMLEDLANAQDLGPALPLLDELDQMLTSFCSYLAKKPWIS